jgi:hypothetical protein
MEEERSIQMTVTHASNVMIISYLFPQTLVDIHHALQVTTSFQDKVSANVAQTIKKLTQLTELDARGS